MASRTPRERPAGGPGPQNPTATQEAAPQATEGRPRAEGRRQEGESRRSGRAGAPNKRRHVPGFDVRLKG